MGKERKNKGPPPSDRPEERWVSAPPALAHPRPPATTWGPPASEKKKGRGGLSCLEGGQDGRAGRAVIQSGVKTGASTVIRDSVVWVSSRCGALSKGPRSSNGGGLMPRWCVNGLVRSVCGCPIREGTGGGGGWSPRYLMSFSFLSRCRNLMGSKGGCFLCKRLMSLQVCVCFEYVRFNRRSRYSSLYLRTNAVSPSVSPYLVQNPIPSGWETPRSQTRAQEMQIKSKRKEAK